MSICIGKALPRPFGSDPGSGFASAACALGAIRDFLLLFKEEEDVFFCLREETDEDATRALDRDAERADIMISFFMKAFDCGSIYMKSERKCALVDNEQNTQGENLLLERTYTHTKRALERTHRRKRDKQRQTDRK
jgi:hypothetical protein